MNQVFDVCAYLINKGINHESYVSNMKLQKLLYFSQGVYLAQTDGNRMFDEPIEAWQFGPVIKRVYHKFKGFGNNFIDKKNFHFLLGDNFLDQRKNLSKDAKEVLKDVWDNLGQLTAFELVALTHANGSPWHSIYQEHSGSLPKNAIIDDKEIAEYFKLLIV